MAYLTVDKLCKAYPSFQLSDISFSVEPGEIVGFVGVNGSGKTTTIKSLLNLIHPDSGEIKFFGKSLEKNEREIKNQLGIVLDDGYFYEKMTLKQMKSIVAPAYKSWNDEQYHAFLERFSLKEDREIGKLSKGMKMKYALALALSHEARLLIMDEPTSGLDPLMREQLNIILREYVAGGDCSVFFSTHITSDLDKIASSVVFIDHGRLKYAGTKEKLLEAFPNIESLMLNTVQGG